MIRFTHLSCSLKICKGLDSNESFFAALQITSFPDWVGQARKVFLDFPNSSWEMKATLSTGAALRCARTGPSRSLNCLLQLQTRLYKMPGRNRPYLPSWRLDTFKLWTLKQKETSFPCRNWNLQSWKQWGCSEDGFATELEVMANY